jgi:hypothetical protein
MCGTIGEVDHAPSVNSLKAKIDNQINVTSTKRTRSKF